MRSLIILALFSFLACSSAEESAPPQESQIASGRFVGQVTETMDAGGYTYVALERNGETVWAAGPQTTVSVGQEIAVDLRMKMDNFRSETLGRTFPAVYFVTSLEGGSGTSNPHAGGTARNVPDEAVDPTDIGLADGGLRVADLWKGRTDLAGQEVVLSGKVVKFTPNVMGRNWVHLQDGTGDPAAGTHDVTVTTDAVVEVGDMVTVRGMVAADQDFGSGYTYDLLVEKASVEKESE